MDGWIAAFLRLMEKMSIIVWYYSIITPEMLKWNSVNAKYPFAAVGVPVKQLRGNIVPIDTWK